MILGSEEAPQLILPCGEHSELAQNLSEKVARKKSEIGQH